MGDFWNHDAAHRRAPVTEEQKRKAERACRRNGVDDAETDMFLRMLELVDEPEMAGA